MKSVYLELQRMLSDEFEKENFTDRPFCVIQEAGITNKNKGTILITRMSQLKQ